MISIVYLKKNRSVYNIQKDYFLKRNMYFHEQIARLGIEFGGYLINYEDEFQYTGNTLLKKDKEIILITGQTLTNSELSSIEKYLQSKNVQVLGCVLKESNFGNKTVLHPSLDEPQNVPSWHQEVHGLYTGLTLPGYTCFTPESIKKSYQKLLIEYPGEDIRLKLGNGYNGVDHYIITSHTGLERVLGVVDKFDDLEEVGVSLEINLNDTSSYGVTRLELNGKEQITICLQHSIENTYTGSELITNPSDEEKLYAEMNNKAFMSMETHSKQLNRFNTDIVIGKLKTGKVLFGITDLSLRTGAATIIELEKLTDNLDCGVYQIYSDKPISRRKKDKLEKVLTGTDIRIVVISRYVITLCYPVTSKEILKSEEFKEVESEVMGVSYDKNLLFQT